MPVQSYNLQGSTLHQGNQRNFIPELWSDEVRYNRDNSLIASRMVRSFQRPANYGDVINIPLIHDLRVFQKTVESQVELQSVSPGNYSVRVDQKKHVSWAIEEDLNKFSKYDVMGIWKNRTVYALARDIDNSVLALRGAVSPSQWFINSSDNTINGTPEPLDDAVIQASIEKLLLANVPRSEIAMFIGVQQHTHLLNIDKYINIDYNTVKPVSTGVLGTIYGVPVYSTTNIGVNSLTGFVNGHNQTPSPTPGMVGSEYVPTQNALQTTTGTGLPAGFMTAVMCHKDWALWLDPFGGMKASTEWDLTHLADIYVARQIYGTKLYRDDHVVLIHTSD